MRRHADDDVFLLLERAAAADLFFSRHRRGGNSCFGDGLSLRSSGDARGPRDARRVGGQKRARARNNGCSSPEFRERRRSALARVRRARM